MTKSYENDREIILDAEQKIKGLKDIDIEIVNLFYYSSRSIKDIAKMLDISELNVKTRLHWIIYYIVKVKIKMKYIGINLKKLVPFSI